MQTVSDVQASMLDSIPGQAGGGSAAAIQSLFGMNGPMQSAFVFQNRPDGVLSIGATTSGGKEMAGAVLIAPIGILAGVALPAFAGARRQSQMNGCINNLRQIDAAKEQWALEQNKKNGDPVSIPGISQYIKGNRIPTCPQGGTYKINAIGANPECDFPGHQLPQF
jgi:hypothetical protein